MNINDFVYIHHNERHFVVVKQMYRQIMIQYQRHLSNNTTTVKLYFPYKSKVNEVPIKNDDVVENFIVIKGGNVLCFINCSINPCLKCLFILKI